MVSTALLLAELQSQRRHVLATLTGLSHEQLTDPVPPTTWAPAAAVHHLALDVERWWFQAVIADDRRAWEYFEENPHGAWSVGDGVDVRGLYETECAKTDEIVSSRDLDSTPEAWPAFLGPVQSVGQILIHVIGETAAHAGQLDIVREAIDGHQHLIMD
ncbi:mycothiol transferase [Jatrophihabitans sp. YIM 134969]